MRAFALAMLLTAAPVFAAAPVVNFDPVRFEQRFNKADKGKKGRLSRAEATAEFPRMPEFFDEIDADKDGYITLAEVRKAMNKRVDAAMNASDPAKRYGRVDGGGDTAAAPAGAGSLPQFSSQAEARRYYRAEFYESLAESREKARARGEPVGDARVTPLLKKSF